MPQTKTGVDFTPDGDFEKSVNAGPTKKHIDDLPPAKEGFIAEYQQLRDEGKELKVGHAGLYWEEDGTAHLTEKTGKDELVETTIDLGLSGKGKLLVLCEEGIANMVREPADDDDNHLPSSKTGVVVHYVIQGIARDFGITLIVNQFFLVVTMVEGQVNLVEMLVRENYKRKRRMLYLIE